MPAAILKPKIEDFKEDKPQRKANVLLDQLLEFNLDINPTKEVSVEEDYFELLYKLYELVHLIEKNVVQKYDGIQEFISYFLLLLETIDKMDINDIYADNIKMLSATYIKKLYSLTNNEMSIEEIANVLRKMLENAEVLESYIRKSIKLKDRKNELNDEFEKKLSDFDYSRLDELYKALYDAISKDDVKQITVCRGRLIRLLKRLDVSINDKYNEVLCLIKIKELLDKNKYDEIESLLDEPNNINYKYYFGSSISNKESFITKFTKLCNIVKLDKLLKYKDALSYELKEHRKVLDYRYSKEFLDKKVGIFSSLKMLPNAVVIAVKKVANSIEQLKRAKSGRQRVNRALQIVKDSAKVLATPALFLGKFITSNWYSLFAMYNVFGNMKPTIEEPEVEIPDIDVPDVEIPEIPDVDIPEIEIPEIEIPDVEIPEIPEIDIPDIDIPEIDIPEIDIGEVEIGEVEVPDEIPVEVPDEVPEVEPEVQPEPEPAPEPETNTSVNPGTETPTVPNQDDDLRIVIEIPQFTEPTGIIYPPATIVIENDDVCRFLYAIRDFFTFGKGK